MVDLDGNDQNTRPNKVWEWKPAFEKLKDQNHKSEKLWGPKT